MACKYHSRASGCKDGRLCQRCHLCVWRRQPRRAAPEEAARQPLAEAGVGAADGASSAGHLTPDPPTVRKQALDSASDGLPSCATTPPQAMDGGPVPRRELAKALRSKLQSVQFQQKRQVGPRDTADEAASDNSSAVMDGRAVPRLEIAMALRSKLQSVQFQERREARPWDAAQEATSSNSSSVMGGQAIPKLELAKALQDQPQSAHFQQKQDVGQTGTWATTDETASTNGSSAAGDTWSFSSAGGGGADAAEAQVQAVPPPPGLAWESRDELVAAAEDAWDADVLPAFTGGGAGGAPLLSTLLSTPAPPPPPPPIPGFERSALKPYVPGDVPALCATSVGSIGHPYTCAGWGCKYINRAKGCKDGRFCVRCHLCQWSRYQKKPHEHLRAVMQDQGQQ